MSGKGILIVLMGLGALLLVACAPAEKATPMPEKPVGEPRYGGTLIVSRGRDPVQFDPILRDINSTEVVIGSVYSTLLRYKFGPEEGITGLTLLPYLAERWQQPDPKTYVFHLARGIKFHNKPPLNGRELTAADVKYSFDRLATEPRSVGKYIFEFVDKIETPDAYTVKVTMKEVGRRFPDSLGSPRYLYPPQRASRGTEDRRGGSGFWALRPGKL